MSLSSQILAKRDTEKRTNAADYFQLLAQLAGTVNANEFEIAALDRAMQKAGKVPADVDADLAKMQADRKAADKARAAQVIADYRAAREADAKADALRQSDYSRRFI